MSDPVIQGEVVATGTAVNSIMPDLGPRLERAMVDAINACYARGVTDPETILSEKMAAYGKALKEYTAAG